MFDDKGVSSKARKARPDVVDKARQTVPDYEPPRRRARDIRCTA